MVNNEPLLTVANQLTILRMGLAPFLAVLVLAHEFAWALVVFVVAGVTDLLDGVIARWGHQRTRLGTLLDPIADKVLLTTAFLVLTWAPGLAVSVPVWVTVLVLSRDAIILVSAAAITLSSGFRLFPPSLLGKASTACQIVTAGVVIALNAAGESEPWTPALFGLVAALTTASAAHYAWRVSREPDGSRP
jgi:cardiolipin synthase